MTVRITGTGANRTYTFEVTAPAQKVLDIAEDAAHHLWNKGLGPKGVTWEQATNAQKLGVLNEHHKNMLRILARAFYSSADAEQKTVYNLRAQRRQEAETKYDIGAG